MQRRFFVVLAGLVLALVAAPGVAAADKGSCTDPGQPGNGASIRVWENIKGDTGYGNDTWYVFCHQGSGAAYSYLTLVDTLPNTTCRAGVFQTYHHTWNDCISSVTIWLPSSLWMVCMFKDEGRQNLIWWHSGGYEPLGSRFDVNPGNDEVSGILITNNGTCVP